MFLKKTPHDSLQISIYRNNTWQKGTSNNTWQKGTSSNISLNITDNWNSFIPSPIFKNIYFSWSIPWVPEVFLACGGNFRCWPIKTWQKPETALEKSLAPRVVEVLRKWSFDEHIEFPYNSKRVFIIPLKCFIILLSGMAIIVSLQISFN